MNDSDPHKPERCRYQLRVRMSLIAVLVLGVFFGWLGSRLQRAARHRQTAAEVQTTEFEIRRRGGDIRVCQPSPNWLENLLHDPGALIVIEVDFSDNAQLGDDDIARLNGLTTLRSLQLQGTGVSDAGLKHLADATELVRLDLSQTSEVTGSGLAHLNGLVNLEALMLNHSQVTDAGLTHLEGLTSLRILHLEATRVSDEAVRILQEALPNCKIEH